MLQILRRRINTPSATSWIFPRSISRESQKSIEITNNCFTAFEICLARIFTVHNHINKAKLTHETPIPTTTSATYCCHGKENSRTKAQAEIDRILKSPTGGGPPAFFRAISQQRSQNAAIAVARNGTSTCSHPSSQPVVGIRAVFKQLEMH
jgi:hypothetical protein